MNALLLNIQTDSKAESPACVPDFFEIRRIHPALTRRISAKVSEAKCPNCEAIVYSRRSKVCGVCAEPLPAALLFSPEESRRIEWLLEVERLRHRIWMRKILV